MYKLVPSSNKPIIMNQAINICKTTLESLVKFDIVKDVIKDVSFQPAGYLAVQYRADLPVTLGNLMSVSATQEKPSFQFISDPKLASVNEDGYKAFAINKQDLFTLVLTDPDAPSRADHKWSEYCHYVVADIPLDTGITEPNEPQFVASKIGDQGNTLIPYMGPGPPKGTGQHRYIFLLYRQPTGVKSSSFTKINDRPNWGYGTPATGINKWSTENKLELIATNFFFAENP